jgi:hypothetical protein
MKRHSASSSTKPPAQPGPSVAASNTITTKKKSRKNRRRPKRIIVLGAGISGLGSAKELVQRGYEVLVVEARSRVGGRLKGEPLELGAEYPSTFPETFTRRRQSDAATLSPINVASLPDTSVQKTTQHPVDLGGALIHGIRDNPIHQITSQMGVPLHGVSEYCLLLDTNGWPVDSKFDERMSNFFNECLDITFARAEQDRNSTQSFGDLFDQVCREKMGGNSNNNGWENPLLKWHRANLELPSGAAFSDLGYTWNEDEPYGFDGVHAAVEPSWKLVMEKLAEGLDVLSSSPVTQIRIILPDGTSPTESLQHAEAYVEEANETLQDAPQDDSDRDGEPKISPENPQEGGNEEEAFTNEVRDTNDTAPSQCRSPATLPAPSLVSKKKHKSVKAVAAPVARSSLRLRGEAANVRRSSRSTKGVIQMLKVGHDNTLSYDDPSKKFNRRPALKRKLKHDGVVGENGSDIEDDKPKGFSPASSVRITLQNGTVLEADALVCTLPLGILKIPEKESGHVAFVPPLSDAKQSAIEKLGCGLLNKCALSFPKIFWQDSDFMGMAGADQSYLILNAVSYTKRPILIFMYGGSFAKEVEDWTDTEIVEDCMDVLKRCCGRDIPDPVDYCCTRWGKEQFSRMSFTYIPPGVDGPKELSTMGEAIDDPVQPGRPLIMFAGEHTTPYHPSTMHGAFLSGIREAYRYDLYMEPALNDHMQFGSSEYIYQHTFPTKRLYPTVKSPKTVKSSGNKPAVSHHSSARSIAPAQERRSRRRGFGGMTLRKRPKTVMEVKSPVNNNTILKAPSDVKSPPESGTRRSQRSLLAFTKPNSTVKSFGMDSGDAANNGAELEGDLEAKTRINLLEDRTLIRALDSYGRDTGFLRSKVLPVFGSTRKRSTEQIRARWKLLVRKSKPPETWTSWKVETEGENAVQDVSPLSSASLALSRSERAAKRRSFVDKTDNDKNSAIAAPSASADTSTSRSERVAKRSSHIEKREM